MPPCTRTLGPFSRVCLLGGGPLLLRLVEKLRKEGITDLTILTSPRHADEILFPEGQSLRTLLQSKEIAFHTVIDIQDQANWSALKIDASTLSLSVGAAWIFKPETIKSLFHDQLLNVHGTRLPQNRGGGAFSWQILIGSRLGFVTIHELDGGLDTGNILYSEEFLYPPHCRTPYDFQKVYFERVVDALSVLLKKLKQGVQTFELLSQPNYLSTYWPRLDTLTHGWVDWSEELESLCRRICAFDDPFPGAQTFIKGQKVHLKKCSVDYSDGNFHPFQNGIVIRTQRQWLTVAHQGGTLIIESIQDENGNSILSEVKVGDKFYTPKECLEKCHERIYFTATGMKGQSAKVMETNA